MALDPARQAILSGAQQPQAQGGLSAGRLAMLGMEPQAPADSQIIRNLAQGVTLGWSDEIEAAIRSIVPESLGGRKYDVIRDEIRKKLTDYKKENFGKAITAEVIGAIIPTVIATVATGGAAAPAVVPTIGRLAGIGALEGAVTGAGTSQAPTLAGVVGDTATGAATGAVLSPALVLGGRQLAVKGSDIVDWARQKFGDKASDAVQAELRRLVKQSGKNVDQIIADIYEGRRMTDNVTLANVLKNYVIEGGDASSRVLTQTAARAKETRGEAMGALQERLAPNMDQNVIRGFKRTEQELLKAESKAYDKLFGEMPDTAVTKEIVDNMLLVARTVPNAIQDINAAYGIRNLVPLFVRREDGIIDMVRQPTLKDAEMVRRALKSKKDEFFKGGKGDLGEAVGNLESSLRTQIDDVSSQLKQTRQQWSNIKGASEAFDQGRKALTANVDELEILVEKLKESPQKYAAFKAGVMDSIRNKARRMGTTFANLAESDKQMGAALRVALDDGDIAQLQKQLALAGETAEVARRVRPESGSPTMPLIKESAESGAGLSIGDVMNVATNNTFGMLQSASRLLQQKVPMLTDEQRMRVLDAAMSDNPDVVRRALTDQTALEELLAKYGRVLTTGAEAARRATVFEQSQPDGLVTRIGAK